MKLIVFLFVPFFIYCSDICLILIVKNDEQRIERCLESVKEIVDCVVVCDAGSTDKTIDIIEAFLQKSYIPGKIIQNSSGSHRTTAMTAAQEMLHEHQFSLSSTYLLVLDGNKIVHPTESFKKESLQKDAYLLLEKSSCYSYQLNLLKASIPWKSTGIGNEYWSLGTSYQCEKLRTLTIEDQGDNQERVAQDIQQIKEVLHKDPKDERNMFYLAQSLKSLQQWEEAIFWYKKRIEFKGDKEEIWFSKYMIGECYKELNNWESALFWLLEAYQYNPDRTEPLLTITTYYRMRGQNDLAYIFTTYGSLIPADDEQIFFNSPPNATYRFDEERSIVAYYTRFREEGFNAASKLVLTRDVPWNVKAQTYNNLRFYIQKLPGTRYLPIALDLPLIETGIDERYHPMNPSILKTDDGYQVICRTVNYTQTGAKIFQTVDKSGIFRTRNFLIHYDQQFNFLSQNEIIEQLPRERIRCWISSNIKGLDDCRIFNLQGKTWFSCTTNDTNPTGNFQISLCRLSDTETGVVDKLVPLLGPDPDRCEKNWVPFIKNGELLLIYSYDPYIIYKPDLDTGVCTEILHDQPGDDLTSFRGSAAPVEFDGGYLMLVHEVAHLEDHSRIYYHRFVFLDDTFKVQKLSKPFIFQHAGVEFCTSMTLDHAEKQLILGVGVEDREAYLCFVDLDTIRSLL